MRLPKRGAFFILAVFTLTGCLAPMTQRQAQGYAALSLRRYCVQTTPCAPARFVKAQRLKPGWLLDYESATAKYGVMVQDGGGTQVTVWAKDTGTATR